jgi:hypothetical protein
MDDNIPCQATPNATLEQQILDSRIPKNEREWWAAREIEKLRAELAALRADLKRVREECAGLSFLLDEHPSAPCDADSVQDAVIRAKQLNADKARLDLLEKLAHVAWPFGDTAIFTIRVTAETPFEKCPTLRAAIDAAKGGVS